ncbi:hypothetical protein PR202_ga29433 [Eleusine coracana subsp. coracana]|uniref:non-specific serine/threonine protein kinase n=1 Tax=Eleusine coracana subsp. coracana TaxID=191504 RepID=A0AAV5DLB9_ELECO|nr:hypothetical protein PR202_ga29433 [Eleusine coracana subsp. coracana]
MVQTCVIWLLSVPLRRTRKCLDSALASTDLPAAMKKARLSLLSADNGNRSNHIFAVELDTIANAEFHDMSSNHIGIDVDSLVSAKAANAGYYDDGTGQFHNLSLISRQAMQVWVDYDGGAKQLTVTMAPLGVTRPKKPLLRTVVDLSDVLQGLAYVGFTSATGVLLSRHFVLGWSFALDGPAPELNIAALPALPPAGPKPRSKVLEIVLPIASATLVLAVGVVIYTLVQRRLKYAELQEDWEVTYGPHRFSYKDLFRATKGFSDKQLLGTGGFGRVYKGVLRKSSMEVAVKKVSHESRQGMKEFVAEVVSIGRLRHRNLVQLLGYCRRKGELLLVYDYMPNGSLDTYLHARSKGTLDWSQRLQIIRGVASGLLYLHEDWEQVVIHRDVKASNVLLDSEMNGRLGDFGLARLYDHGTDAQTTHVVGTMGYLAPELGHTGKAAPSTDVFAFGAFLLQINCGRRPVALDEQNNRVLLIDWVIEQWHNGLIINAVDRSMPSGFNPEEVSLVLKLGLLCSHPLPVTRPTMRQVMQYLDGDMPLPDLAQAYLGLAMLKSMHSTEFKHNSMTPASNRLWPTVLAMFSKLLLVPLLLIHVASATAADGQFVYHGFAKANLAVDGVAVVTPGGLLEVTNATDQAKGHAFHPTPLQFLDQSTARKNATASTASTNTTTLLRSFSTCFVFAIVSTYEGLSSHGLAFVVASTKNLSTANSGQYLGLLNATSGAASDHVLAIELDTITDPEFHDINSNHVGVDVNSLVSKSAHLAGYYDDDAGGVFRELKLNSHEPMQVWVDYDGRARQLDVTLAPVRGVPKPKKPLLSTAVDLSVVFADPMYVGFSAGTGVLSTSHNVLGWSFSFDGPAPPLNFSKLPALPRLRPKPRSKVLDVILPLATALIITTLLATIFLIIWRRRMYSEVREDWEEEFGPHRFAYKDLFHATGGFKDRNLLGVGGFGRVYKGILRASDLEIAVKKVSHDSRQGVREFIAEVVSIGRLRHRNLVQLLGYCRRKGELLLVYDYMANGSLDKYLYDPSKPALSWQQRYWIIKGVASSILYLHEDWDQVVIHRDIKASNVLLDHDMNGRLGDFGLARLYDHSTDPQTTHVVGTMGYLAPELVRDGKATPATDVFAFGAFLLEVVCGRRPIERSSHGNSMVLVDWVMECHGNGTILNAVDPRLGRKYNAEEVNLVLNLGMMCSHPLPGVRPNMRKIVQYLESDHPVPDLSPSYTSYDMLRLMQIQGFDSYATSSGLSVASIGASSSSVFSEGR